MDNYYERSVQLIHCDFACSSEPICRFYYSKSAQSTTHHQFEEIKAMRLHQRGYGSIAKSLGLSKSTVQRLCKSSGI